MNPCTCGCIPQPHTHVVQQSLPKGGWDVALGAAGSLILAVLTAVVVDATKESVKALLKA